MTARKQANNQTAVEAATRAASKAAGAGKTRAAHLVSAGVGVAGMIIKAKRKRSTRPVWTKAQQESYQRAVETLEAAGFRVRREELKRGHCWRVVSGACRSRTERYIFVDSRLSAQEQIAFLTSKAREVATTHGASEDPAQLVEQAAAADENPDSAGS